MSSSLNHLRIVVQGYIVRGPIGGMAWHHLNYLLGLKSLGHDVLFLEDSDEYPSCYDPTRHVVDENPTYGLKFADEAFARLGRRDDWAYFDWHRNEWHGGAAARAIDFCRDAELVLNVSGVNPLRPWTATIPRRAFIDTDPLFTQIGHVLDLNKQSRAAEHNCFFTFGELLAKCRDRAPDDGFAWQPTRQPIALDAWPTTQGHPKGRLTTVMQWESYPAAEFDGVTYGMKNASFPEYFSLPRQSSEQFELSIGGESAPRDDLREFGWQVSNPLESAKTPWEYQDFIRASKAEFAIAKHGYVISRCGWFSERSACYLASGRPAIVQDTGFSELLPTGRGLLPFADRESAADAVANLSSNYDEHCRSARAIAAEYFDAGRVLLSLINRAMNN